MNQIQERREEEKKRKNTTTNTTKIARHHWLPIVASHEQTLLNFSGSSQLYC
jgi:hypothetical protein